MAAHVVTTRQAKKFTMNTRHPARSAVPSANSNELRIPIPSELPRSSAPRAASFAVMIVDARSGNGPRTIASRRSNVSASHAYAATRPMVIMLGRNRIFTEAKFFGIARGLAVTPEGGRP